MQVMIYSLLIAVLSLTWSAKAGQASESDIVRSCYQALLPLKAQERDNQLIFVPGLFEAIPKLRKFRFDQKGSWHFDSYVSKRHVPETLTVGVDYEPANDESIRGFMEFSRLESSSVEIRTAALSDLDERGRVIRIPSWIRIPGIPELVPGKGIPTSLFMMLRGLKILKVAPGTLKTVTTTEVVNLETVFELNWLIKRWRRDFPRKRPSPEQLGSFGRKTKIGRFIENALIQSGHRIKSVKVESYGKVPVSEVLETIRRFYLFSPPEDVFDSVPKLYGMRASDVIYSDFYFEFFLEDRLKP